MLMKDIYPQKKDQSEFRHDKILCNKDYKDSYASWIFSLQLTPGRNVDACFKEITSPTEGSERCSCCAVHAGSSLRPLSLHPHAIPLVLALSAFVMDFVLQCCRPFGFIRMHARGAVRVTLRCRTKQKQTSVSFLLITPGMMTMFQSANVRADATEANTSDLENV